MGTFHFLSYLYLTETWVTLRAGPFSVAKTGSKKPFTVSKVTATELGLNPRSCLYLPGTLVLSQCSWPLADDGDGWTGCYHRYWL